MNLEELLKQLDKLEAEARGLLEKGRTEKRSLTDDEQKRYDEVMDEIEGVGQQIENVRKMQRLEGRNWRQGGIDPIDRSGGDPPPEGRDAQGGSRRIEVGGSPGGEGEFRSLSDFFFCALNPRERWPEELRNLNMTQGESGGFLVPAQFRDELMQLAAEQTIVRSRATVIPAGERPDAPISMPALTQGDDGVLGGVSLGWIGEGQEKPEQEPKFHQINLQPKELAGHIAVTDTLLRNSQASGVFIRNMLSRALAQGEDLAFLNGNGIGKPQGMLNANCALGQNRNTANTVEYEDLSAMQAQMLPESLNRAVWVVNQSLMPDLNELEDPNGNYIFTGANAVAGTPATLLGMPVVFTGKVPSSGNAGDLSLCDFSYYLIKDGSGPFVAASEHVLFKQNQTVVKAFQLSDGQCWVRDPLLLDDGSTRVSPVVVLV